MNTIFVCKLPTLSSQARIITHLDQRPLGTSILLLRNIQAKLLSFAIYFFSVKFFSFCNLLLHLYLHLLLIVLLLLLPPPTLLLFCLHLLLPPHPVLPPPPLLLPPLPSSSSSSYFFLIFLLFFLLLSFLLLLHMCNFLFSLLI